jgi:ARG/rhodanese/phosphatase superfamily protein
MYIRNWFSWGSIGLALAVMCLLAPGARNAQKGSGINSNEWRLAEPIRYENLTLFPVLSRQSADTASFATLDEGLAAGQVVIMEGGAETMRRSRDDHPVAIPGQHGASVNQLVLINRGSKPLLLLAGELVSGGKQDRIIGKDRIVPPGAAPLPLDVFCVEAGRWTGGAQFSAGQLMVHPSVREQAAISQEQAKVWDAVRNGAAGRIPADAGPAPTGGGGVEGGRVGQTSQSVVVSGEALSSVIATEAPTQSYEKIYKSSKVSVPVDTFAEEIQKRFNRATGKLKGEFVVGVVVAYGGEVAWGDIFASPMLFERYWPKLLRSYVVEALTRPKSTEQPSIDDAHEFLKPFAGHESVETEPGIYTLREVTEGKYVEVELEALRPADITLHVLKVHRTS